MRDINKIEIDMNYRALSCLVLASVFALLRTAQSILEKNWTPTGGREL